MRIACIGGGPGGLFFAALARRSDPTREVTVFDRNRAGDTFGFGVVFSDATLAGIDNADPVLRQALTDHGVHWDSIEVRLKGESIVCDGNGMAAVERKTLLALLHDRAIELGVNILFETDVSPEALLNHGYDLVVGSDGANSTLRDRFRETFQPKVEIATAKFIWFGTSFCFDGLTFIHEHDEHGVFAAHAYPYSGHASTFIVETDEGTWSAAGLDEFDSNQPQGPSDLKSKAYLEKLFAPHLNGHPLLVNSSRWGNFRTWSAQSWYTQAESGTAVALIGDAAHTAHFSVGSGTKMAMEDAVALAAAIDAYPRDLDAALANYQAVRQLQVARIQGAARPSLAWWEHFGRSYRRLPPWQFAYHFLSRSLTDSKLVKRDRVFVESSHAKWRDFYGEEPLESALQVCDTTTTRLVQIQVDAAGRRVLIGGNWVSLCDSAPTQNSRWGLWVNAPLEEHELPTAFAAIATGIAKGACLVAVAGGTSFTRRLLTERIRLDFNTVALLIEREDLDVALTAVLAGRTDLFGSMPDEATR